MRFSIIVVSLNSGFLLGKTIDSILQQSFCDFEIVIKDGGSTDSSISSIPSDSRIKLYIEKDSGIYDAMNRAIFYATGEFIIFMNCGDTFFDNDVLLNINGFLANHDNETAVYYGDCYTVNRDYFLKYPNHFNDYVCLTKTLCHQSTVYNRSLFAKRAFDTNFKIEADFEFYVYLYSLSITFIHMPIVVCAFEGGGASETRESRIGNLKRNKSIIINHLGKKRYRKARIKAILHGAWIKEFFLKSRLLYPFYCRIAKAVYDRKR